MTACSSPTPPAAPPSGATPLPPRPSRSTSAATARRNNSLFEDNAEHGLGLALGYDAVQEKLVAETEKILQCDKASDALKEAATTWLENRKDTEGSKTAAAAYIAELEKSDCETAKAVLADKAYLTKKAFWIFGGDGRMTLASAALTTSSPPATT